MTETNTHMRGPEVGIVGSGVVGLNTGIEALKQGYRVSIFEAQPHDKRLGRNPERLRVSRASEAGAAQWFPFVEGGIPTESQTEQVRWIEESLDAYMQREVSRRYQKAMQRRRNIELMKGEQPMPSYLKESLQRLGRVSESSEIPNNPLQYDYAYDFTTFAFNSPAMLQGLRGEFKALGGKLVTRNIESQDELFGLPVDVLVNCMGLKARDMFPDLGLEAVKGQLLFYQNPGIDTIVSADDLIMIPRSEDRLVVGCLYIHEGDFATAEPTADNTKALQERMNQLVGIDIQALEGIQAKLAQANMVGETTGLRPYRKDGILIAAEDHGNKILIHHVGHGGMGWTVSPGTAKAAVRLIKES